MAYQCAIMATGGDTKANWRYEAFNFLRLFGEGKSLEQVVANYFESA